MDLPETQKPRKPAIQIDVLIGSPHRPALPTTGVAGKTAVSVRKPPFEARPDDLSNDSGYDNISRPLIDLQRVSTVE